MNFLKIIKIVAPIITAGIAAFFFVKKYKK